MLTNSTSTTVILERDVEDIKLLKEIKHLIYIVNKKGDNFAKLFPTLNNLKIQLEKEMMIDKDYA